MPPETDPAVSVTREVGVYKTTLDGQEMLLVDTPGFEDNKTSNLEILQKICEYILQMANNPACVIHGAVYVHNVATSRWLAGDERTWAILKALCGDSAMGNVVVATTRWPADHQEEDYEKLEKRNLEDYWGGILDTVRLTKNDVQNSRSVIRMLLGVRPRIFQAQWELSNGNTPSDTSAGRIAITEGEEALSKAEREKEYALAELERVSLQVEPSRDAPRLTPPPPPPPPGTRGHNATDFKKEMDSLLLRLESAINANKSQLTKIKSSEKTLQEEILQVQALLREKEDLLKRYHQLRRKIESFDKLNATLRTLHRPIAVRKISMKNLLAMLVVGGAVVVEIGSMNFPFYGFAACGVMLLYKGVAARMKSRNANPTPPPRRRRDTGSQASRNVVQTSCVEPQIPTMNIAEEGDSQEKGGPAPQEPPLPPTAQRRSSWFSFWWT
ncbi:hypothetical protein B9Z19DRAFT_1078933 [Tuber borchii]|uniref:AIG1-type G domain-containing protein n=1 Tax=Tuber borchii TaxID=42251 RepID=A0A2T6ZYV9_TUBBO|nr:hypothetical protein B9Z19DRAFT_1078933 [Tuber borchii]